MRTYFAQETDKDFIVASQLAMALETENLQLDANTVSQGVSHIFAHPEKGFYLIAKQDGVAIGTMLVLYEWSDWRNGEVLWIHSLFVVEKHRKQGVFKDFYLFLQNLVAEKSYKGIRLYVEKTNHNAQLAYQKMGMTKEHYELYEWLK